MNLPKPNAPPVILTPYGRLASQTAWASPGTAPTVPHGQRGGSSIQQRVADIKGKGTGKPRFYAPSRQLVSADEGFSALSRIASRSGTAASISRRRTPGLSGGSMAPSVGGGMHGFSGGPGLSGLDASSSRGATPILAPLLGTPPHGAPLHGAPPHGAPPHAFMHESEPGLLSSASAPTLRPVGRRGKRAGSKGLADMRADSFGRLEPLQWLG